QQLLNGPDVVARFEQVRRERVSKRMTARRFANTARPYRGLDGALDGGSVHVMTASLSCRWLAVFTPSGEDPLPDPLVRCVRVLRSEGVGQFHEAGPGFQIALMKVPTFAQIRLQFGS